MNEPVNRFLFLLRQQLSPQWIYSLAVNEALKGKELWLIDSIPMEDAFALYL